VAVGAGLFACPALDKKIVPLFYRGMEPIFKRIYQGKDGMSICSHLTLSLAPHLSISIHEWGVICKDRRASSLGWVEWKKTHGGMHREQEGWGVNNKRK
jgi:hypothetical protein